MLQYKYWDLDGVVEIAPDGFPIRVYSARPLSISQALLQSADKYGPREAIVDNTGRTTYEKLVSLVSCLAGGLVNLCKVEPGDRVAFLMSNHGLWPTTYLAIAHAGAVSVPLNNRLQGPEIAYQIKNCGAKVLLVDNEFLPRVLGVKAELSNVEHIFVNGFSQEQGIEDFGALFEHGVLGRPVPIGEESVASILYTSGTTGFPKGAMLSHRNILSVAQVLSKMLQYDETDRMLFFIPLFHVTGLVGMLMPMILKGGANVILPGFDRHAIPEVIEREKITATMGVPATFILLMESPNFNKFSRSSMRSILYGGAPSPPEMHSKLEASLPGDCILVEGYGLTEASSNVTISPVAKDRRVSHRYGTIGVANPLTDLRVLDLDGSDVQPGEIGELWVRGPGVCKGYWAAPEKTAESLVKGWLATGDLVSRDSDGFFKIMGRKKHMINRGGENIYPVEVENVMYAHPNILEAAVVGVPDRVMGEEVKAVVVPKETQLFDKEEFRAFLRDRLADYKVPRFISVARELPRNPGGKVIIKRLLEM